MITVKRKYQWNELAFIRSLQNRKEILVPPHPADGTESCVAGKCLLPGLAIMWNENFMKTLKKEFCIWAKERLNLRLLVWKL